MIWRRSFLKALLVAILGVPALAGAWGGWVHYSDNLHTVKPGILYRSGQLEPDALAQTISEHGIKTVINLRGAHPGMPWYDNEVRVSSMMKAKHVDLQLSAKRIPSLKTVQQLDLLLRNSPKPILIHCYGGADRSGLAAALFEANILDKTPAEAGGQLSFYYGHFPWLWSRSGAMDIAFGKYVGMSGQPKVADR